MIPWTMFIAAMIGFGFTHWMWVHLGRATQEVAVDRFVYQAIAVAVVQFLLWLDHVRQ